MAHKENPTLHKLLALLLKCCQLKNFIDKNTVSIDETLCGVTAQIRVIVLPVETVSQGRDGLAGCYGVCERGAGIAAAMIKREPLSRDVGDELIDRGINPRGVKLSRVETKVDVLEPRVPELGVSEVLAPEHFIEGFKAPHWLSPSRRFRASRQSRSRP